ncbi:phosphotransferase family protein [Glycomyces xiaoerkulensis]|uniref:phosphotransferase n=1 Tax=Glycomyces xiaoerkulensis TaxID=2038139 RepID=UPI000C25EB49|nr:phosphotransferase [Glycomyces xiaoerkulensis]
MSRFGTPVPYDATAVRLEHSALPAPVRERIAKELGAEPVEVRPAGGGFTGGFAALVRSGSGAELFVKAAGPDMPFVVGAYRLEAEVNPALPEGVPVPRLRFAAEVEGWTVLGFEAVRGRAPRLPVATRDLDLMLRAWAEASERLAPVPQSLLDLGFGPGPMGEALHRFAGVASGEVEPFPVPPALEGRIDELAELESRLEEVLRADEVIHFDLRTDNMIVGADRAWICDWNGIGVHAAWFDTANFLVVPYGDGHDADRLLRYHPTAVGVADEQIDTVLAAVTGYYLAQGRLDPIEGASPYLREHQWWCGLAAADWLAGRRGWR